jgi:hypothetical protein
MISSYQRFAVGRGIAFEAIDSVFKCEIMGLHLLSVDINGSELYKITKKCFGITYIQFIAVHIAAENT